MKVNKIFQMIKKKSCLSTEKILKNEKGNDLEILKVHIEIGQKIRNLLKKLILTKKRKKL